MVFTMKKDYIQQISIPEERETQINIDYFSKECELYTNNATVMNRLQRKGIVHSAEQIMGGNIYSRTYKCKLKDIGKLIQVSNIK